MPKQNDMLQMIQEANKERKEQIVDIPIAPGKVAQFKLLQIDPFEVANLDREFKALRKGKTAKARYMMSVDILLKLMPQYLASPDTGKLVFASPDGHEALHSLLGFMPAFNALSEAMRSQTEAMTAGKNGSSRKDAAIPTNAH